MPKPPPREDIERFLETLRYSSSVRNAAKTYDMPYSTGLLWVHNIPRWYPDLADQIPDKTATPAAKGRREVELQNGMVFVGGDGHYWPGQEPPTAHRAFVYFLNKFKKEKKIVIVNGDTLDFPRISRHPPQGWQRMPEPQDEIEHAAARMGEIKKAAGKAPCYWPEGNHDARFEMRLASLAPEFAKVHGVRLQDHFPDWEPCWSVYVNNRVGGLVVKHRMRGGIHATWNNTLHSAEHLHKPSAQPEGYSVHGS